MSNNISNIYYISPRDMRKNRADAVHIMLTSQSFANQGIKVKLITPTVDREEYNIEKYEIFALYGISSPNFDLIELNTNISEKKSNKSGKYKIIWEKFCSYTKFAIQNINEFRSDNTIIYSKCYTSTLPFICLKRIGLIKSLIIFETITPKNTFLHRLIYRSSDKIISHLKFVTEDIIKFSKTSRDKIFEPPYFTQSEEIEKITANKKELREELGLKPDGFYVLYAGKAGDKVKQAWSFIDVASHLKPLDFLIVGANKAGEVAFNKFKIKKELDNLEVHPFKPLTEYYKYVKASDILIGYYPATHHNKYHLSPGKSGIYFASKNPCVFSDLPSLRSIFPDDIVFYAEPDNNLKLVEVIQYIKDNPKDAAKTAGAAFKFAQISTYHNFAERIVNFIDSEI